MKTININKQALTLAHLLAKTNKVMTTKAKPFSYFLTIAYKMLKNNIHFVYVLRGLSKIYHTLCMSPSVDYDRFQTFGVLYLDIRHKAPLVVRKVAIF